MNVVCLYRDHVSYNISIFFHLIQCVYFDRDLGSSFPLLRILWMPRCNLEDLDGVTAMVNLKELYLAYNDITDLSPLSLMTQLQILDLEGYV